MATKKKSLIKVVILGDSGVGKTALMNQFLHRKFIPQYKATIGAEFYAKDILIDDELVSLQIWDTAGQERFQSIGSSFYRGAECCILVYDITLPSTFESLTRWKEVFLSAAAPNDPGNFPFLLLGNKLDREVERKVPSSKGLNWCKQSGGIPFLETSAKDQTNVMEGFMIIAKNALKNKGSAGVLNHMANTGPSKKLSSIKTFKGDSCSC